MSREQALSELIGRIYDCAVDVSRWPGVLGELAEATGSKVADIAVYNMAERTVAMSAYHNYPDWLPPRVMANVHLNPAVPVGYVIPLCEPYCLSREVTLSVVQASPYWKTTWQDAGTLDGVTVPLTRNVVHASAWQMARAIELGAFPDEALDLMRLMAPHIRRAIEISGLLSRQKQLQGAMQEVLEAISAAAFVLSPDGAIRFRNSASEGLLAEGNHVRLSNGRLLALSPTIKAMMESVASGGVQTARDMMVETRGGQALQVTCARLDRVEKDMDAPILLLLRQPEPDLRTPISIISQAYGLTTSETIVLSQVMEGRTLDQAAELIGVARSTVKTQLDSIYAKSGVRRQTDLMRKIAGLIAPIG